MLSMRSLQQLMFLLTIALLATGCNSTRSESTGLAGESLADVTTNFEEAFNAQRAPALASLWTDDAVYRSTASGKELNGRDEIADAYQGLFEQDPNGVLTIHVQSAKVNNDKTATLVALANVDHSGQAATQSLLNAKLVQVNDGWYFSHVDETELPGDAAGLNQLEWLVGKWSEELPDGRIVHQFRWLDDGAFMLREYRGESKEGPAVQGTQVLGWDPEQSCIRTWLFDSGGGVGEGYWEPQGDGAWINKLVVKLHDGRRASTSQVLRRIGDHELTLQSIDREIDGEVQPNGPVAKLTRFSNETSPPLSNSTVEGKKS